MVVFEEIAAAGDQVDVRLLRAAHDPLERGAQIPAALLGYGAVQALASKRSIQMQVSEMY
jgi:hypothetical protein